MRQDIINYLNKTDQLSLPPWPSSLHFHVAQHFYDCIRCQHGRATPKGLEYTLVPGQCRHGKWAPGTNPRELARKAKEEAKKTPIELWKEAVHR